MSCPFICVLTVSNIVCLITFPLNKETQYMQMHTCSNNISSEYRNLIYANVWGGIRCSAASVPEGTL